MSVSYIQTGENEGVSEKLVASFTSRESDDVSPHLLTSIFTADTFSAEVCVVSKIPPLLLFAISDFNSVADLPVNVSNAVVNFHESVNDRVFV